jgi:hypothetical protein
MSNAVNISTVVITEQNYTGVYDVHGQINHPTGYNSWRIELVTIYLGTDKRAAWEAAKAVTGACIEYHKGYYGRTRTLREAA